LILAAICIKTNQKKKKKKNSSSKPQQKSKHGLQQVAECQPGDRLKEHKNSSLCQPSKRCEKSEFPHITCHCLLFFTEIFHLLDE